MIGPIDFGEHRPYLAAFALLSPLARRPHGGNLRRLFSIWNPRDRKPAMSAKERRP
jgi:hypothetical protein